MTKSLEDRIKEVEAKIKPLEHQLAQLLGEREKLRNQRVLVEQHLRAQG